MTGFNGVRGADGALYHTTTSAAARLGISYEAAKTLIASGRIASVSAESVGVSVNKPGARLVSEAALIAYQRGGGATVIETPTAVVGAGGVHIAPVGAVVVPAAKPKRGRGLLLVGVGCIGALAFIFVLIVIVAILGSSDSGSSAPSSSDSGRPPRQPNDLVSPCQLLFAAVEDADTSADYEAAVIAWTLTLKASDNDALGFSSIRERDLYRDVRDSPVGEETGLAVLQLTEYCVSLVDG